MNHKLPIVSGLYYRRANPLRPVLLRNVPGGREWIDPPKNQLVSVDFCGAGCLLIGRSVIETIPQPWFEWKLDHYHLPEHERMSEDFAFCEKARNHGFSLHCDTSVVCQHVGYSSSVNGVLSPLELQ